MDNKTERFFEYITEKELKKRFRLRLKYFKQFFPQPKKIRTYHDQNTYEQAWSVKIVEDIMEREEFKKQYYEDRAKEKYAEFRKTIREQLIEASSINSLVKAFDIKRKFILHIGPTNSGKTFHALKAFANANSGLYLAPLRLLALEIFDTLNSDNIPCALLTGEEKEEIPFYKIISSTIEMCDYNKQYDVAVIDECQMIADERRGQHWTKAILQLDAKEIHLCLAPEAENLIISLLNSINAEYTIQQYERLVPLKFSGSFNDIKNVKPGDALIVFSRKKVLSIAAELEDLGIKTSVLYGWLPPVARREELNRFNNGKSDVLISTDAIGMGVSLPIKRIIFCEIIKWNDGKYRQLTVNEIKQIAGRAGRYGKYKIGEVLTMVQPKRVEMALNKSVEPLSKITLPFPGELLNENSNIKIYLQEWEELLLNHSYNRERMDASLKLLMFLKRSCKNLTNEKLYKLIRCPFDTADIDLIKYWQKCSLNIYRNEDLSLPDFNQEDLTNCEKQYRASEIRYRLTQAFNLPDQYSVYRQQLCIKINELLLGSKSMFLMQCRICGKRLPALHTGTICQECAFNEKTKVVVNQNGHFFTNTIADIARFEKRRK